MRESPMATGRATSSAARANASRSARPAMTGSCSSPVRRRGCPGATPSSTRQGGALPDVGPEGPQGRPLDSRHPRGTLRRHRLRGAIDKQRQHGVQRKLAWLGEEVGGLSGIELNAVVGGAASGYVAAQVCVEPPGGLRHRRRSSGPRRKSRPLSTLPSSWAVALCGGAPAELAEQASQANNMRQCRTTSPVAWGSRSPCRRTESMNRTARYFPLL